VSRKMKVLISLLVAVLVFTIGGTAMALAQEDEDEEEELVTEVEANGLLSKIAEILDIPEDELREAFAQAREELREERFEVTFYQLIDKAEEEELITPEEAEAIREWWEQKPEALDPALLQRAFNYACPRDGQMPGIKWGMRSALKQRLANKFMERAMERECITQGDAGKISQWQENKPEALNNLSPRARVLKAQRGRQMLSVAE
jgi:hypothetical protein